VKLAKIESAEYTIYSSNRDEAHPLSATRRPSATVEVIVSTFNSSKTVVKALNSILSQDLERNMLCIFVHDDGSTDSTVQDVLEVLSSAPVSFYIMAKRQNTFESTRFAYFFKAIYESESEYLAFLDGDDYWTDNEKLTKQLSLLSQNPRASLVHSRFFVTNDKNDEVTLQPGVNTPDSDLTSTSLLWNENYIGTLTVLLRRSSVARIIAPQFASEMIVGDYPVWLSACSQEGHVLFLADVTANYVIHGANYWASGSRVSKLIRTRRVDYQIANLFKQRVGFSVSVRVLRWAFRLAERLRNQV
jgi:glycosyltransferase involved in cell wall biosynthesis